LVLQDTIRKTRNVTENELFIPHPQLTGCVSIQKKLKDATEGKVLQPWFLIQQLTPLTNKHTVNRQIKNNIPGMMTDNVNGDHVQDRLTVNHKKSIRKSKL